MKILSNVIRGGQLSLHAIRMFKQVLHLLLLWWFFLFLVIFFLKLYGNTNIEQWKSYSNYQIATFLNFIHKPNKQLEVSYGRITSTLRAVTVVESEYFRKLKTKMDLAIEDAVVLAIKFSSGSLLLIAIFFVYRGFKKTGEEFVRGAKLSPFNEIKSKILKDNKGKRYKAFNIAGMPYPYSGEMQHTLVIGASGVGKTVLISGLVEQIKKRGEKAIIYDRKGDYTKWFYDPKKDYLLNPFDERSKEWNLLKEIGDVGAIKQIARAFIPEKSAYAEESKIWDEAARITFTEIISRIFASGDDFSNQQISESFLGQDLTKVADLVKGTHAANIIDLNSPKTAASVLFVLSSHFSCLRLNDGMRDESFSIRNWVLNGEQDSILFITSKSDLSGELLQLQAAWFEIAINSILSKEEGEQKTWVILDELPTMSKIPSLQNALAISRSYGGCFVLGVQNIAQLYQKYGKDVAQDISSECSTRCIFKSSDPDTAKWLVDNIGSAEVREYKEGLSYGANTIRDGVSVNTQDRVKNILLPSEIQSLPRLNLYLKMPDYPAVKTVIEHKVRSKIASDFKKNESLSTRLQEMYKKEFQSIDNKELDLKASDVEKKGGEFYKKLMEDEDDWAKES